MADSTVVQSPVDSISPTLRNRITPTDQSSTPFSGKYTTTMMWHFDSTTHVPYAVSQEIKL